MNGIHDCGGMDGFGPVQPRADEPLFKYPWQRRVFGMMLPLTACPWFGCADRKALAPTELAAYGRSYFRSAIERMDPAAYIAASYYERHLFVAEQALVEAGVVSKQDLEPGLTPSPVVRDHTPALRAADVPLVVQHGVPSHLALEIAPRFREGDRVVAVNDHHHGHTRLPRYARGRPGVVLRDRGVFEFDDSISEGISKPQHLYEVRFAARDLWGAAASAHDSVVINLWDDHLLPG